MVNPSKDKKSDARECDEDWRKSREVKYQRKIKAIRRNVKCFTSVSQIECLVAKILKILQVCNGLTSSVETLKKE